MAGWYVPPMWWARLGIVGLAACSVGRPDVCDGALSAAARQVQERWPTIGHTFDDPYNDDCAWYWAHAASSVDGFGVTLVTIDSTPSLNQLVGLDLDQEAAGPLRYPSLLFFDQTDAPHREWPLIGMGHHFHFDPCVQPDVPCVDTEDCFVHEARHGAPPGYLT